MMVYDRVVIDIASGRVVEARSLDYDGPIAHAKGEGEQTSTMKSEPAPAGRREGRVAANAEAAMTELLNIMGYEREVNPEWQAWQDEVQALKATGGYDENELRDLQRKGKDLLRYNIKKRAMTPDEQTQYDFEQSQMARYRETMASGKVPPDVQAYMDEIYGNQMRLGTEAIDKAAIKAAGGRGLGLGDTPIGDPYLRATADLGANLGAAKAQGMIGLRGDELNRAGSYLSYMDQLKQLRGFQNPYSVADMYKNFALGLYGPRFSKGTVTQTLPAAGQGFNLQGAGGGAASGALAGASFGPWGAAAGGIIGGISGGFSSEKLKDDIIELAPSDYEEVLETVKELPVKTWKYKRGLGIDDTGETHIGPTVEDSPPWMRTQDGMALKTVDYLGTLTAAVKGLAQKVERLEGEERGLGI